MTEGLNRAAGAPFKPCTDMPYYDGYWRDPAYYAANKGWVMRVVWMRPATYFKRAAEARRNGSTAELERANVDLGRAAQYAELMRAGVKFPIPVLDFVDKTQEGRHRAAAAELLGLKRIPVFEIRRWRGRVPDKWVDRDGYRRWRDEFNAARAAEFRALAGRLGVDVG